jgi:hypothetical protein
MASRVGCRVGILYRGSKRIESVCLPFGGSVHEESGIGRELNQRWTQPDSEDDWEGIQQWLVEKGGGVVDQDDSYLSYFYRCLTEGSVYYYLYEKGVGWSCGDVTGKTPISSQLVKLSDAIHEMEYWAIGLKYQDTTSTVPLFIG